MGRGQAGVLARARINHPVSAHCTANTQPLPSHAFVHSLSLVHSLCFSATQQKQQSSPALHISWHVYSNMLPGLWRLVCLSSSCQVDLTCLTQDHVCKSIDLVMSFLSLQWLPVFCEIFVLHTCSSFRAVMGLKMLSCILIANVSTIPELHSVFKSLFSKVSCFKSVFCICIHRQRSQLILPRILCAAVPSMFLIQIAAIWHHSRLQMLNWIVKRNERYFVTVNEVLFLYDYSAVTLRNNEKIRYVSFTYEDNFRDGLRRHH